MTARSKNVAVQLFLQGEKVPAPDAVRRGANRHGAGGLRYNAPVA
jgi:hypothetical protein